MDALTSKALESLLKKILPALLANLGKLQDLPAAQRQADDMTAYLLKEASELLTMLHTWAAVGPAASGQTMPASAAFTAEAMSDDEARQLLSQMDEAPAPIMTTADEELSDEEARRMLAEMDGPAEPAAIHKPVAAGGDAISDDEARRLLAAMDEAPIMSANGGSSAGEEEALQAMREADAPAPGAGHSSGHSSGHSASPAAEEELVTEIPEFGESEFGSDPDMIRDFINNADELMETLDTQILLLEQEPGRSDVIEEIFRAAHTLKGAAGMFAFQAIERVMHRMENYFDQLRKGKRTADGDGIDVILRAMDVLRELIGGVREAKPSGTKTAPIVSDLNALCAGAYRGQARRPAPAAATSEGAAEGDHDHAGQAPAKEARSGAGSPAASGASHSNKVEQSTIRVDLQRLDALVNLVGELVIDRTRFLSIEEQLRTKGPHPALASNMTETVQLYGRHMNEVQDIIMKIRMVPIGNAFNKFPRVVRDLAKSLQKEIDLLIDGETTELDKTLVEQIGDPLVHLIRNAVDHGIEMPADRIAKGKNPRGKVVLAARQEGNQIIITIEDDGKGLHKDKLRQKGIDRGLISEDDNLTDRDIFNLIFEAGFSTAEKVTNISGRGVGMDVVKKQISKLKGIIDLSSTQDQGTLISIQLPLTLAIVQSLLVQTKNEVFAIPLSAVVESLRIKPSDIQRVGEAEVIKRRNMVLPLLYLDEALDLAHRENHLWYKGSSPEEGQRSGRQRKADERLYVVVVGNAERRFGIVVNNLLNQQEMVIKPMGPMMQDIPCVAGGAILGNGEVVLVLDIAELEDHFRSKARSLAA